MKHTPVIDKSVCWPLLGYGLLGAFVFHPYVAFVLWGLALAIALQEVLLLAALPVLALVVWWGRLRKRKKIVR